MPDVSTPPVVAAQYHADYAALIGGHEAGRRIARQVPCNALSRVVDVVQTHPWGVDQQGVDIFVVIDRHGIEYPVTVAAFGPEDGWEAIVLGLFNNFVVYSRCQQYDSAEISEYIRGAADDGTPRHINARLDIAVSLNPFFPEMSLSPCHLAT